MFRVVRWWIGVAASVAVVVAALMNASGTCVDAADVAASSCTGGGSGGLLLIGLGAVAGSAWMLRRTYRAWRCVDPAR